VWAFWTIVWVFCYNCVGVFDNCAGVLKKCGRFGQLCVSLQLCGCFGKCTLVFTVFCIVCTAFIVSFRLCIFNLICFV
jgi:hypothetical protein